MVRARLKESGWLISILLSACSILSSQKPDPPPAQLNSSGQIVVAGRSTPYLIRHLPVSSFTGLPDGLASQLNRRGCLIPQTYEAHQPENVVHASLERAGSSDWAVLCSEGGTVSLLIFFSSAPTKVQVLASAPETDRLQAHDPSGVLGFNWGIDPASPEQIHAAQIGVRPRPGLLDHDALADSVVDGRTVYHFYVKDTWTVLRVP
jgi:hypothetical protein